MTEIVSLAPLLGNKTAADANDATALDRLRGGAISIGNFDGVHRGHATLLKSVRNHADRVGGPAIAVVLDPHPATILRPDHVPPKLMSLSRRAERMGSLGIDFLVACETTKAFLELSAETFFQSLVIDRLQCRSIVEGPNFFFGHGRGGDVKLLASMCQAAGITLDIVEPTNNGGQMISSTRIRELLERSEIEQATDLLGGYHQICGIVVQGDQRGRQIGFPTANLAQIEVVIPAPGVYAGIAHVNGVPYTAAIHLGPRPTFDEPSGDGPRTAVEVHLLDYTGDLYGQTLTVDVITHVRDIARFDSADALATQLTSDVKTVRERIATLGPVR